MLTTSTHFPPRLAILLPMRPIVCWLVVAGVVGGCSLDDRARNEFSRQFTCPTNAITVQERDDLNADELIWGPPASPPPEVAKDPERLALWQQQHALRPSSRTVFHVQGCKHDTFYACGRSNKGHPMCSEGTYRPRASGSS
jgi:hypothetical protein